MVKVWLGIMHKGDWLLMCDDSDRVAGCSLYIWQEIGNEGLRQTCHTNHPDLRCGSGLTRYISSHMGEGFSCPAPL